MTDVHISPAVSPEKKDEISSTSGLREFTVSDDSEGTEEIADDLRVRGGDLSLGSPPRTVPEVVPEVTTSGLSNPAYEAESGSDAVTVDTGPGGDVYLPPVSTDDQVAEAAAFTAAQKAAETPAQKQRANKAHGAVFSMMQYRVNPDTGEVMLTQEQIDRGIQTLEADGFKVKFADIWHGRDRYTETEADLARKKGRAVPTVGALKALHWHSALWLVGGDRSVRQIANAFGLPAARVRTPRELSGERVSRSPFAAEDAFFDFCGYLTHEDARSQAEGKYLYPDEAVRANFDFRADLDANRVAAKARREARAAGGSGGGMKDRVRELRRRVGRGELTLDEAEELDFDAWAEDLPRLERLRAKYEEREGLAAAAEIGTGWRKSFVAITGPTRNGKDLLAAELGRQLVTIAGAAGREWTYVKPPGKNSLEDIGRAEVVHHEDARFRLLPDYDEALRYFDPNQAVAASGRHKNRGVPTPRAILATSSETLLALAFTFKRRLDSDVLAEREATGEKASLALDVDEFLYRIGWYAEVQKPADAGGDVDAIRRGAVVTISRVVEGTEPHRTEVVYNRAAETVGRIRTQHKLEPVAAIRGIESAARFLAAEIIFDRNPDIAEALPADDAAVLTAQHSAVTDAVAAHNEAVAALLARWRDEDVPVQHPMMRGPAHAIAYARTNGITNWAVFFDAAVAYRGHPATEEDRSLWGRYSDADLITETN